MILLLQNIYNTTAHYATVSRKDMWIKIVVTIPIKTSHPLVKKNGSLHATVHA